MVWPMRWRSFIRMAACGAVLAAGSARADSYTGTAWAVHFNRPDQGTSYADIGAEEYVLRDALLARIDALASNDWGCLATYTFSGNTASLGAAGPILLAMSNALARGVQLGFVADNGVNLTSNYWPGISLTGLSTRAGNKLALARAPADSGIMHDKVGVFWYRTATQGWVVAGSWNFTGGASSYQWNLLTEIQDNSLAGAYSNEMREMLSGRFHANPVKSHAHDGTRFRIADMATNGWVRFAPYPDEVVGGSNALTDILGAIDAATNQIVFGLNKLTSPDIAAALVRACDRGVSVNGSIPKSDRTDAGDDSYATYQWLSAPTNYATGNRVWFYDAYLSDLKATYDTNGTDLTHAKYMVIDPDGANPLVIQGSANWTEAALLYTNSNDENVQFLPHAGMARALAAQFEVMTDGTAPWSRLRTTGTSGTARLVYWLPYTNTCELVHTTNVFSLATWTSRVAVLPAGRGTNSLVVTNSATQGFYRIRFAP